MDLITRKIKPRLREMMAPFNEITKYNTWEKKLISCGNAIEQNNRIYKNANHRLDWYRNNNNCDNNNRDNNNRSKRQGNDKQSNRFNKNKRSKP